MHVYHLLKMLFQSAKLKSADCHLDIRCSLGERLTNVVCGNRFVFQKSQNELKLCLYQYKVEELIYKIRHSFRAYVKTF